MKTRRQKQRYNYTNADKLFNLKPYRDYIDYINNIDKDIYKKESKLKGNLPKRGGLSSKELENFREVVSSEFT